MIEAAITAETEERVAALLRDGTEDAAIAAAREACAAMDRAGPQGAKRALACGPGCSSCCHVHVEATGPELMAIAAFIREALTDEAQRALKDALDRTLQRVADLDDEARWEARIPCALLDPSGLCAIHPVRPLRCRAFHSLDAAACRAAFEGRDEAEPPRDRLLDRAQDAVEEGYDRALGAAGIPTHGARLEAALGRLLLDRD
ncbi:MAG: YkgJ family cysteine cluster protein [Byssovorax sp.]